MWGIFGEGYLLSVLHKIMFYGEILRMISEITPLIHFIFSNCVLWKIIRRKDCVTKGNCFELSFLFYLSLVMRKPTKSPCEGQKCRSAV